MRAVLDPNVLVSALLAREGAPAQLVTRWFAGEFELVVSEALLAELERALGYRKLRLRVSAGDVAAYVDLLRGAAIVAPDPHDPPRCSSDPGDDYLIALAEQEAALLVSGDRHLLELEERFPIQTARGFLESLSA